MRSYFGVGSKQLLALEHISLGWSTNSLEVSSFSAWPCAEFNLEFNPQSSRSRSTYQNLKKSFKDMGPGQTLRSREDLDFASLLQRLLRCFNLGTDDPQILLASFAMVERLSPIGCHSHLASFSAQLAGGHKQA